MPSKETTKSHTKIDHKLQVSKGWTPKRWKETTSKEINVKECHQHTLNIRITNSQRWSMKKAFNKRLKKMDYHQKFIHLLSDIRHLEKWSPKNYKIRPSPLEQSIESKESTSRICKVCPTFSQLMHLEERSQKDNTPKKCKSSNLSKPAIRRCQGRVKLERSWTQVSSQKNDITMEQSLKEVELK